MKSTAYLSLVCPILEYSSSVWDPYLFSDIQSIKKVQRHAARWVSSNYNKFSSVTSMLNNLQWPTYLVVENLQDYQPFIRLFIINFIDVTPSSLLSFSNSINTPSSQFSLQYHPPISEN